MSSAPNPRVEPAFPTSIAAWLTVSDGVKAVDFYKAAFGATELYRHQDSPESGIVAKLSIQGAIFWISGESSTNTELEPLGAGSVRLILSVADPDSLFAQALAAGATEVFPVGVGYGWRLGRLVDPFGLHWEIGHELQPTI